MYLFYYLWRGGGRQYVFQLMCPLCVWCSISQGESCLDFGGCPGRRLRRTRARGERAATPR